MILCNFSNTNYHLNWYKDGWDGLTEFIDKNKMDGIELLLHGNEDVDHIPKGLVKGLHLSYFPTWLEFYKGEAYELDFPDDESLIRTFGGTNPLSLHDRFKRDFEIAKKLDVDYMVYHVSHVRLKDAFSFEFTYSDKEVLDHTLKIVNDVFKGKGPRLLFENLWWPGLTLDNRDLLETFLDGVKYENKGIMLDLSHMILKGYLENEADGLAYILDRLDHLGDAIKWIKGLHINGTDSFDYMQKNHLDKYKEFKEDPKENFMVIYEHISSMDKHVPLMDPRLNEIIKKVDADYHMIEVVGKDRETWESYVKEQLKVINVL
ncbi:TIM barrel protein [Acidaminobacter sp. JC074]|uniref:TIM barrel protein n=1 Tax=Acidaminobacter sp. JC074 TaxID=2530199 RepID=UPI001F0F865F|nr:TIM barrel protein [Acidaminobacter sp. JC074]MCH4888630.1 TIM barrel protein [Acidaminobacter sp. JC074]